MPAPARLRRPEARPQEIIDAALALFSERGFAATRLDDVAERAGLSKAAIYLYFEDKMALLRAIVNVTAAARLGEIEGRLKTAPADPALRLRLLLEAMGEAIDETPIAHLIKLIIAEARAYPEIGRLYLETVIGRALPLMESLIAYGIAKGAFRPVDPAIAVRSLIGPMLLSALWRSVFEPLGAPPVAARDVARLHADLLLGGLSMRAPEPKRRAAPRKNTARRKAPKNPRAGAKR